MGIELALQDENILAIYCTMILYSYCLIQSLNKFASANLVIAGEPPNVGQDYFPWIGRHSIGRVWGLGKFCRPEGGWPCSQAQGEGAAGEPWQGGL